MSELSSPPLSPSAWTDDGDVFSPTTDMYAASAVTGSTASISASSPGSLGTAPSDDTSDERHAASVALRRQRNRESMRRTRLRAKETLTELRGTLSQLEAQYARLLAAPEASVSPAGDAQRRAFVEKLQARLLAVVQMRRALEHENGVVRTQIEQRQALERELQQIADENQLDEMFEEKLALLGGASALPPRDKLFTPVSHAHAHSVISAFCHELTRVRAAAAAAATTAPAPLEVFGWGTRRHVDPRTNEMHFEFTKLFGHITAHDMMERAWAQAMDLVQYRARERELNIRRLEFLQHLSSDLKIMVRETVHPVDGTIFRTNYLLFRVPLQRSDGDGVLVGMYSLNPPPDEHEPAEGEEPGERVVWIDVWVSVEMVARGPCACEVSWRGRTNYKSPQYAAENAVRFLMGLLRWEQAVTGPLITLF